MSLLAEAIVKSIEERMKEWYVFDMDGTLADVGHRAQFAQVGEWDEFHSRSPQDEPYGNVMRLATTLTFTHNTMVVTGRSAKYRQITEQWLERFGFAPDEILMRPDDDFTQDWELKIRLLEQFFGSKGQVLGNVVMVFEDRDQVVQGLRDYGLTVAQTREGDY